MAKVIVIGLIIILSNVVFSEESFAKERESIKEIAQDIAFYCNEILSKYDRDMISKCMEAKRKMNWLRRKVN